jgi:aspartyl-tRNA(Asn)/glutamyl-tRNA(Gln) amidotransferase subunit A
VSTEEIAMMPATALLHAYAEGKLSPVEAVEAALERVARYNPQFNAFVMVDAEGARAAAREAEARWQAGRPRGKLDGVPTSIKDLALTKDWPTLRGSKTVDPDQPWQEDAPFVARLREAGAIFIGKTTTPEMGWKGVTDSPLSGVTRNPWNPDRTPGGSSGGAAVSVATGMASLAQGTDGGGSIRIPSGFTGIFGIKPSFGRVPLYPPSPFGTVAHAGPMTRTVADAALMLTVMAEPDTRDFYALPYDGADYLANLDTGVEGKRIAFSRSLGGHPVESEIARLVAAAAWCFEDLGAEVEEADPPIADAGATFKVLWSAGAAAILDTIPKGKRKLMDPGLLAMAEAAAKITSTQYIAAERARFEMALAMARFHESYDLLVTPSLPLQAFEAGRDAPETGDGKGWTDWTPFSYPFNLTKQPAASVPCGLTADGLPAGLQIVGPAFADQSVLAAARAYEQIAPWPMPPLA